MNPNWPALRYGDFHDVLNDVPQVDALICDPPYGDRTHAGQYAAGANGAGRRKLNYESWTPEDVHYFVNYWAPRTRGWMAIMSCSDLAWHWRDAMQKAGRYAFAPVPCVIRGMTVRLGGDGPSSWAVYLNVSRPRSKEFVGGWTRPGAYVVGRGSGGHIGGKPLELMRQIVADYSREGDLVCDPCAGYATTGIAAWQQNRQFVGAEVNLGTWMKGWERLGKWKQNDSGTGPGDKQERSGAVQ